MKMSPIAEKALRGSIRKWTKIVNGTGVDNGSENCPLCKEFLDDSCHGCPVRRLTGKPGCNGTPYNYNELVDRDLAMLNFLKALLPDKP